MEKPLLDTFLDFGLAGLIGFVLGIERDMSSSANPHAGSRDFVLMALIGAISCYISLFFNASWLILAGLVGPLALLVCGYLANKKTDSGITTEITVILSYFLGVLVMAGASEIAIALAIATLLILSQKQTIETITSKIQTHELQSAIKLLVITFIILPALPNQPLSGFMTVPFGVVQLFQADSSTLQVQLAENADVVVGSQVTLFNHHGENVGTMQIETVDKLVASGTVQPAENIDPGELTKLAIGLDLPVLGTMLSALNPYRIWLIVVLVSMISLIGYVLVKLFGAGAGIGLTGLIGGLASSTVTTVSFAKRSIETPALNRSFAVAILLASSIMFFRLLLEIAIVNQELMKNMMVPLTIMGTTGIATALFFSIISRRQNRQVRGDMQLNNPFCLKSAITFGAIFSAILMITRLGTVYLGNHWLPLVAVISGLVDADAIAFSLSDAHKAGIISLDWASFNLILGALSNTIVKLFFVFSLGHRNLLKQLAVSFFIISLVGIATTWLYYDI